MFHGVDERVPVDGLKFGVRVLDRFIDSELAEPVWLRVDGARRITDETPIIVRTCVAD